jgi:hypothetical protein
MDKTPSSGYMVFRTFESAFNASPRVIIRVVGPSYSTTAIIDRSGVGTAINSLIQLGDNV